MHQSGWLSERGGIPPTSPPPPPPPKKKRGEGVSNPGGDYGFR